MLGHDGPPAAFWRENLITNAPLERCPVRTLQLAHEADPVLGAELDRHVDDYYPAYEDGHLLEAGGIGDQPARYLALMRMIRATDDAVEAKYTELTARQTSDG